MKRRRPVKRLVFLAFVLMILGGLFYTTTEAFREHLRGTVVEFVDTRIAGDFSIERIESASWGRLDLQGIELATDGETVARIESIGLRPVWRALLRRRFRLARIVIESPELNLRIDPDGGTNWSRALAPIDVPGAQEAAPGRSDAGIVIPAFIEAIAIRDGSARIETPARRPFEIVDLDAELRIDSRSNRITVEQATVRSAASALAARGEIKPEESLRLVFEPLRLGASDLGLLSDSLADLPEITGRLSLEGPLREVAIEAQLQAPEASARLSASSISRSPRLGPRRFTPSSSRALSRRRCPRPGSRARFSANSISKAEAAASRQLWVARAASCARRARSTSARRGSSRPRSSSRISTRRRFFRRVPNGRGD